MRIVAVIKWRACALAPPGELRQTAGGSVGTTCFGSQPGMWQQVLRWGEGVSGQLEQETCNCSVFTKVTSDTALHNQIGNVMVLPNILNIFYNHIEIKWLWLHVLPYWDQMIVNDDIDKIVCIMFWIWVTYFCILKCFQYICPYFINYILSTCRLFWVT